MSQIVVLGGDGDRLSSALTHHFTVVDKGTDRAVWVAFPDAFEEATAYALHHPGRVAGLVLVTGPDCQNEPNPVIPCPTLTVPLDRADVLAPQVEHFITDLPIHWSKREHRAMEQHLDRLHGALRDGLPWREHFYNAWRLAFGHYLREDAEVFQPKADWPPARKMMGQHAEASEFGRALEATDDADAERLARRYWAISQHNIIEEERDVFPCLLL